MEEKQSKREKRAEYLRKYYEINKERIKLRDLENKENNPEMCKAVSDTKYQKHKKHMIQKTRERRVKEPERELLYAARNRARTKNLPFDLELSDIVIPEYCPLLEIPLQRGVGAVCPSSPTIDRMIPRLGYVKSNIWVVSHRANMLKNSSTLEELELIVKNLKERKNERTK
jgi:hypothetical protein